MSETAYDQRLARFLMKPLARTPVTPNQITTFGLVTGLVAAMLLASGSAALADLGALLFMLAVLTDHADGELARMTGRTSAFGHHYDNVAAFTTYVSMFVGLGLGLRGGSLGGMAGWVGLAAGISVAVIFSTRVLVEQRHGKAAVRQSVHGGFEIEDVLYVVGPVTWIGWREPFLIAAGVGAPLFLIWVLYRSFGRAAIIGK